MENKKRKNNQIGLALSIEVLKKLKKYKYNTSVLIDGLMTKHFNEKNYEN